MDVSIESTDKQAREAFIKAREEKQAAKELRAQQHKDRANAVATKRLRRHIKKAVRTDLLTEKRNYRRGEATGGRHSIKTVIDYKGSDWRFKRVFVEAILEETLAKHTGFEYEVDFVTSGEAEWCYSIHIWYTLLED